MAPFTKICRFNNIRNIKKRVCFVLFPDINFNNCDIPERKLSIYVEADLITNKFTAGSLVWAKVYTYPWWPAMVDDDPDTEQYYWIEDYDLNIPVSTFPT